MKRIISIAVCLVMSFTTAQSFAQKHNRENCRKQRTENYSKRGEREGRFRTATNDEVRDLHRNVDRFHSHESMVEGRARRLQNQLDLTSDQYKMVVNAGQEHITRARALTTPRQDIENFSKNQRDALRREFNKMRSEYDTKLKNILDESQWEKYQRLIDRRRPR